MQTKTCPKCGQVLPATTEYFNKQKDKKDGLRVICKECSKTSYKDRYAKHKEEVLKKNKKYYEENKYEKLKSVAEYRKENKEKIKLYMSKHYDENKEETLNKAKAYYKKEKININKRNAQWKKENKEKVCVLYHKRKAKFHNLMATLNIEQWDNIKNHFNNKCAYCGKELDLTQDHFIPLSADGEYTSSNIIPACQSCNSSKHNKDFFEWYPKYKYYSQKRETFLLEFLGQAKEVGEICG